jgi:hypothetical protein
MSKIIKTGFIALIVVASASPAFAVRHRVHHRPILQDQWFQPLHLDDAAVPAGPYFEQMRTDGN